MSFARVRVYPANPNTTRGSSTKIDSHGDKIIYANGKSIIIRDLANPGNDLVYSGHIQPTTAARISPSGYYAASADTAGNVRIWDIVGSDQVLKSEYKVLGGRVNDLAWDGESKRIIAVGDGREKFGHVFQFDTGTSAGEIQGHNKALNSVAIRQQRPFRAATAGDDGLVVFHTGTPYVYASTQRRHKNFVHSVSYAPSGSHFVSTGSDSNIFLWDGTTGEYVAEFANGHKGSVFSGAWSPDSTKIATSSADGTVKLWDAETRQCTTTYTLGSGIDFQQVGSTWTSKDVVVSIGLNGVVNVFDQRNGVQTTLHGSQKPITSTTVASSPPTFFTGSGDGRIHSLSLSDNASVLGRVSGAGHSTLVSGLVASSDRSLWTAGFDDSIKEVDINDNKFTHAFVKTASQPRGISVSTADNHIFVAESSHIEVLKSSQKVTSLATSSSGGENLCLDVHGGLVAVGGKDSKVRLYNWTSAGKLEGTGLLEGPYKGEISAIKFSGDGTLLAVGDSSGKILVFDMKERKVLISRWTFHTSRIYSLAWTEDGAHVASASLDTHIYVWSIAKPLKYIALKNAIPGGAWGVQWVPVQAGDDAKGKRKLLGAGSDASVRAWEVTFHEGKARNEADT